MEGLAEPHFYNPLHSAGSEAQLPSEDQPLILTLNRELLM